jgi:hypothetical protein
MNIEAELARENIIHAAMIRAALVASRGLPPSQGCLPTWNPPATHYQACGASPQDGARCEHWGVCEFDFVDSEGGEI